MSVVDDAVLGPSYHVFSGHIVLLFNDSTDHAHKCTYFRLLWQVIQLIQGTKPKDHHKFPMDGASLIAGQRAWVGNLFETVHDPSVIHNHCISHLLVLASEKAAKSTPYLEQSH